MKLDRPGLRRNATSWLLTSAAAVAGNLSCGGKVTSDPEPGAEARPEVEFLSAPPFRLAEASWPTGAPEFGSLREALDHEWEDRDTHHIEGDVLYLQNSHRGLMIFDLRPIDAPRLVGHSPLIGRAVELIVRGGTAFVAVLDWFGRGPDGKPFGGSLVQRLDIRDPENIQVLGEVPLRGEVRDMALAGDLLYAVFDGGTHTYDAAPLDWVQGLVVASLDARGGGLQLSDQRVLPGYRGAVIALEPPVMMAARGIGPDESGAAPGRVELQYLDLADPTGVIQLRGSTSVRGFLRTRWGGDPWRMQVRSGTAALLACGDADCGGDLVLSTIDIADPDRPVELSSVPISEGGEPLTGRIDGSRLVVWSSVAEAGADDSAIQLYDLTEPHRPRQASRHVVPGGVRELTLAEDRAFVVSARGHGGDAPQVLALDISRLAEPALLSSVSLSGATLETLSAPIVSGDGTAVAVTVAGAAGSHRVDLFGSTPSGLIPSGSTVLPGELPTAELVRKRWISLAEETLAVVGIDGTPIAELELARNVVGGVPQTNRVSEWSKPWSGADGATAVRLLPRERLRLPDVGGQGAPTTIDGRLMGIHSRGELGYAVSAVRRSGRDAIDSSYLHPRVTIVDLSGAAPVVLAELDLPHAGDRDYGSRREQDRTPYGWYAGAWSVLSGDVLALRRTREADALPASTAVVDLVDLSDPTHPVAAEVELPDHSWWGNLRAIDGELYINRYEPVALGQEPQVRYYLHALDVSDRSHPALGPGISLPGFVVGGSDADGSVLYTIDYRWQDGERVNELAVVRVSEGKAELLSRLEVSGRVGAVFVRGERAYFVAEQVSSSTPDGATRELHEVGLSDPAHPVDRVHRERAKWPWLVAVESDRLILASGFDRAVGVDVYRRNTDGSFHFEDVVRISPEANGAVPFVFGDQLLFAAGQFGLQAHPLD